VVGENSQPQQFLIFTSEIKAGGEEGERGLKFLNNSTSLSLLHFSGSRNMAIM
jgi:hypothetical protein